MERFESFCRPTKKLNEAIYGLFCEIRLWNQMDCWPATETHFVEYVFYMLEAPTLRQNASFMRDHVTVKCLAIFRKLQRQMKHVY